MCGRNRSSVGVVLTVPAMLLAMLVVTVAVMAQEGPPPGPPPGPAPSNTNQATPTNTGSSEARRVRWSQQVRLPKDVKITRDLEYARAGETPLLLDLYVPEDTAKPRPLVVWIHGGGWRTGSKEQCRATPLAMQGYVVASINYRLVQDGRWPAQIHDCKAAIRWLRSNADTYGIDPKRIGVWGSSAGGHLAALLGTSGDVKELEGTLGHLDQSSRVQAVCNWCGPSDLLSMAQQAHKRSQYDHNAADSPESVLVGGALQELKDKARAASPITYVSGDDPPFLIMHGDNDRVVPYQQSVILDEALRKAGVESSLHTIAGGGHAFGGQMLNEMVLEFFDKHLKSKAPAAATTTPVVDEKAPAPTNVTGTTKETTERPTITNAPDNTEKPKEQPTVTP
ncbi:MAG: alpha/beta hydrolase fold domain-containing protein [Planctomycetes bacterium]|nr:alpha/beta hydrolase fold domain-containing protein [Planctomycetota bacterium]